MMENDFKSQALLIEDNVNVGKQNVLVSSIQLLAGIGLASFIVCVILISGSNVLIDMMPQWMDRSLQKTFSSTDFVTTKAGDKKVRDYLQIILNGLLAKSDLADVPMKLVYSDDKQVNAFAVPGNRIIVTKGLFEQAESENELAMILAHELGHFAHRDHLKGFGRTFILGILTSLIFQSEEVAQLIGRFFDNVVLSYSREQEYRADKYGVELVNKVYQGNSVGILSFFERLKKKEGAFDKGLQYFSTHPLSSKRVDKLKDEISRLNMSEKGKTDLPTFKK
jgi:predicted Zn-dependent protease